MGSLGEGKPGDIIDVDFGKAFDTVSYIILVSQFGCHNLDGWMTRWVKNWLHNQAQRMAVEELCSTWRWGTSGV